MAIHSFNRVTPIDCLKGLREKVLCADISAIAAGSMLFNQDGVIVTDDIKDGVLAARPLLLQGLCLGPGSLCDADPFGNRRRCAGTQHNQPGTSV